MRPLCETNFKSMKPHDSKKELQRLIGRSETSVSALTPADAVHLMLQFYKEKRVEGAALDEDQDMLLFQWGTYDRGGGQSFQFDIIRHFIESGTEDEDGMSQLSLTCFFQPTPGLIALKSGEEWCHSPDGLIAFKNVIFNSAPYQAVAHVKPASVSLAYNAV